MPTFLSAQRLLHTGRLGRSCISLGPVGAGEEHVLIVSCHLLDEVADVLSRPRIQARWPLSGNEIESYCQYLSAAGEEVKIRQLPPVEVICTGDTHFPRSVNFP